MRRLIESGQSFDEALFDKLLSGKDGRKSRPDRDLTIMSIILLSVSTGLGLLALLLDIESPEVRFSILGAAALTTSIGVGGLIGGKISGRWYSSDCDQAN